MAVWVTRKKIISKRFTNKNFKEGSHAVAERFRSNEKTSLELYERYLDGYNLLWSASAENAERLAITEVREETEQMGYETRMGLEGERTGVDSAGWGRSSSS